MIDRIHCRNAYHFKKINLEKRSRILLDPIPETDFRSGQEKNAADDFSEAF